MDLKGAISAVRRHAEHRNKLVAIATSAALMGLIGAGTTAARAEQPGDVGKPTYAYVGSYPNTSTSVAGDGNSIGISVFRFDPQIGTLTPVQQVHSAYPSWLTLAPSKRFLYACYALTGIGTNVSGSVEAYEINPHTGTLKFLNRVTQGIGSCAHAEVDPTGRHLIVSNYGYGNFAVLPIDANGRLDEISGVLQDFGYGPNPRQDTAHPHAANFSPDGRFIGAADLGNDTVQTLRLQGGALARVSQTSVVAGTGPRHLAFSHDSKTLYMIGELSGTITVFSYDPASGKIGQTLQTLSIEPPGYAGVPAAGEIAVSPSGKFLYASDRGSQTISSYRIDQSNGTLSLIGFVGQGVNYPNNFVFDPSGKWLYVVNTHGNNIEQFSIDHDTGELTPHGQVTSINAPDMMVFRTPRQSHD